MFKLLRIDIVLQKFHKSSLYITEKNINIKKKIILI